MIDLLISGGSVSTRFAERVDPRAKFILLFLFYVALFMIPSGQPFKLTGCLAIVGVIVLQARIPLPGLIRFLIKIYPMILIISFLQILTAGSRELLIAADTYLGLSTEKWRPVLIFQFKSILVVCAAYIFMASTPARQVISVLNHVKLPGPVVSVIFFAYQFLFILARELERIRTALRARYINLSLIRRVSLLKNVTTMYFLRLFERSEGLNRILLSRGFSGSFRFNAILTWKKTDSLIVVSGGLIIMFIIFVI